jgi:EmrB/QacA subfamily drug resistance transporter
MDKRLFPQSVREAASLSPAQAEARPAADKDRLDPAVWKIAAVAMCGTLLSMLDATIVNVSLSSLATDLHTAVSTIQWVMSGYLLALTLVMPLSGWLVDRLGAKALYLWCFAAFTATSALCGLAWSANALIGFRLLQGASGGLLAPMTQMIIARAAGSHMPRVMGYMGAPLLLAPILGPAIAGGILEYASWRWLFLVNLPIGVTAILLALRFLPADHDERRRRPFDWLGMVLLCPGLALSLYGIERLSHGSGPWPLALGAPLLAAFMGSAVRKGDRALIDLRLFRGKEFSAAATTQFLSNGVIFAGQMLIPFFLIEACAQSPAQMGWMLAPTGLGMLGASLSMGALTARLGIRTTAVSGALLSLAGTAPFLFLAGYGLNLYVMLPALFVRGIGQMAVMLPSLSAAYVAVPRHDLPMATTTLNIVQRLGGPTLTTVCATLLTFAHNAPVSSPVGARGYIVPFVFLCALQVLTCVAATRLPRRAGPPAARPR